MGKTVQRRQILSLGLPLPPTVISLAGCQATATAKPPSIKGAAYHVETWLDNALQRRGVLQGRLEMSRFVEPVYYLLSSTFWIPTPEQAARGLSKVAVPRGFVTDLASIPAVFFALLRPDGNYAHAAIVHDFMYWDQSRPKADADNIFRDAMRFLEVSPAQVHLFYDAVRTFGGRAWKANKALRGSGESRYMKILPEAPNTRWAQWKKLNVFY